MIFPVDAENYGDMVKARLKKCGKDVVIRPMAKIIKPEMVEIGDHTNIEDFVWINGGMGITIGKYNHLTWHTVVWGGGVLITEDYVSIESGVKIVTGSDHYRGGKRMSSFAPMEDRAVFRCRILIERDAFIGPNAVILPSINNPDIVIGEGAIIGSLSLVTKSVESWSINLGIPCQKVGERPKVKS